jgi:hypothetical protein
MSDPTAAAIRKAIGDFDAGTAPNPARENCAKLVEEMLKEPAFSSHARTRLALMIAARSIRRGRHLTPEEKFENIVRWCEEGETAA